MIFVFFLYTIGLGMVLGIIAFRKNFTYLSRLQKLSVVLIGIGVTGIFFFTLIVQIMWTLNM